MADCFFAPACIQPAKIIVDLQFQDEQSDANVPLCLNHLRKYQHDPTCHVREILAIP